MQTVETEFDLGHYRHTQLERVGDIAIYQQQHKENPKVIRYEVVRIRIASAHTWPNGTMSPEREFYPGANTWGRDGFTTYTLDHARALALRLGRPPEEPNP